MIPPPRFASVQEHIARAADVDFWQPYVMEILRRHGLTDAAREPVAGFNATYPTFVYGDVVVKLFGGTRDWRTGFAAERSALALVATDPGIAAPTLVADGWLYQSAWPYLVLTRVPGVAWNHAGLAAGRQLRLAAELGRQLRRVHMLPAEGVATDADWPPFDVTVAAMRSSLPPHLAAQAADYLARLGPPDPAFVHGDLGWPHVFVMDGEIAGIIDWGDAMVTDRHFELIQIYRGLFDCDKELFRVFLDGCDWPLGKDFPRQVLGHAIRRQAVGLAQHHIIDVFEPIAAQYPLPDIATLDELATILFEV